MINGSNVINIEDLKNAIPVTFEAIDPKTNQKVVETHRILPKELEHRVHEHGQTPYDGISLIAYSVNTRGLIWIPINSILTFGDPIGKPSKNALANRPKDPVTFARVLLYCNVPPMMLLGLCDSITKELHWALQKLEFFRLLGHAGYSALEEKFDEIWSENQDDDCPDPAMTEEQAWDKAIEEMRKEE